MNVTEKKARIRELWQLCFHDDERFVSLLFDNIYRDENARCFEEDGVLTAALQMLPYRMTFGTTLLKVSYISGAATRPEYRNRGLMGRLLKESFEEMLSRKIPFSALIPAEPWLYGYYASKGYAPVFFRQESNYTSVHKFDDTGYHRVIPSVDELYRFFDSHMRRRPCCVLHERIDFEVICADIALDKGEVVAVADCDNRLVAQAFVVPGDDRVVVKELLAVDLRAEEAVLHQVERCFPGRPLSLLHPPGENDKPLHRVGMLRIIDVERVLEAVAEHCPSLRITVKVADPLMPSNDGIYLIEKGSCRRVSTGRYDLDVDVAELAAVIFGASKLSSLFGFPAVRPYMSLMLD